MEKAKDKLRQMLIEGNLISYSNMHTTGVYKDYVVAIDKDYNSIKTPWDEEDGPFMCENDFDEDGPFMCENDFDEDDFDEDGPKGSMYGDYSPTIEEVKKIGKKPLFTFDIAINHKGSIQHGFIIYERGQDKSKRDQQIRKLDENTDINIYYVEKDWILKQSGVPKKLEYMSGDTFWKIFEIKKYMDSKK